MKPLSRIAPAPAPFEPTVADWLRRTMPPGQPPLQLFAVLARDPRLFGKFFAGGLLDRGHLTLRQRELVIDRTTARHGCAYEWGVHVAVFGARIALTPEQQVSLVHGTPGDGCWPDDERCLLQLCDELHRTSRVCDATWQALRQRFGDEALLELLLLVGFYTTTSYLANTLQLEPEPGTPPFPAAPHGEAPP
ncbi:carboxymuconolactone decarboxylase family protein [Rubrivivax sp. RP6-9]|uniref:carboxymuconolactone decarboxylase family protein n=1 Tax=Rubrivivax sp. RP6-9 TaxID=3415750 RepID=UPI003CC52296